MPHRSCRRPCKAASLVARAAFWATAVQWSLLWGAQTWTLGRLHMRQIDAEQLEHLRRMIGFRKFHDEPWDAYWDRARRGSAQLRTETNVFWNINLLIQQFRWADPRRARSQ